MLPYFFRLSRGVTVPTTAIAIAAVMVLPLALLELINVPQATEDFPIRLFAMMFGNALLAAACVVPALLELIKFRGVSALKGIHWAGLMAGVLLLWAFGSVVTDQWSCFIGIPNCD